jgi:hypothetical protein
MRFVALSPLKAAIIDFRRFDVIFAISPAISFSGRHFRHFQTPPYFAIAAFADIDAIFAQLISLERH